MLTLSIDVEQAKLQLATALAEPHTIKMLIFGNGGAIAEIVQKAQIRAKASMIRRVIWVQNPAVLTKEEIILFRQGSADIAVCVLNLDGKPVHFVPQNEANSALRLERAFNAAEKS